jgi:hypothetical protein
MFDPTTREFDQATRQSLATLLQQNDLVGGYNLLSDILRQTDPATNEPFIRDQLS